MSAIVRFRANTKDRTIGRWYLDLDNGEPWIPAVDPTTNVAWTSKSDRDSVRAWRDAYVAAMAKLGASVRRDKVETVSQWYGRYYDAAEKGTVGRKNRGKPQAASDDRRARFKTWIEPLIGDIEMTKVTSADLRKVVAALDDKIRERSAFYESESTEERKGHKPGISAKTAAHVWSEVTSGFREAANSKDASLLVRPNDDPTRGMLPPTTGEDREQAALYPAELLALLACERIPITRRRTYAVCAYAGLRRSEAERVTIGDVDLDHDVIRVRGKKTDAAQRTIPIEPGLRPLLADILREAAAAREDGEDERTFLARVLLDVPRADGRNGSSDLMRKDLVKVGLTRADLSRDDDRHMPFTFHGLRHTCITHWVVAGRSELFLLTAGGHTDVTMTRRYLAQGAAVSAKFGCPHPPIPKVTGLVTEGPDSIKEALDYRRLAVGPAGLEPATYGLKVRSSTD